ncbi:hypothetical protein HOLleu_40129 [Holothuria leucospilota]|uniref:Uncharacterized protein n=1 Tax=Holothuria leucospilota TaxID=206669 RepID=A0A9Q0YHC0_HOLLE|nr:hypothetical protein HOLleu_40129 [Holothuria leucospilota]
MDPRLQHPFTCVVAGPTQCGKTVFLYNLLSQVDEVINGPPEVILWFYGEYQPLYDKLATALGNAIQFIEGVPQSFDEYLDKSKRNLIILDDLMNETADDKKISNLFTKGSHHKNLSVILVLQNLFQQGRVSRTISLNSHYIVLFKNPRDASQISFLARQMFPEKPKYLQEAYRDATKRPYGYLFIDLKGGTEENYRLRTQIFPGETQYAYVKK